MAPLPKRKYSKSAQGKRRSHIHQKSPSLQECPQCHQPKLSHRLCPHCGYYGGREVIPPKAPKRK